MNAPGSKQNPWRIAKMSEDSNCVQIRWDNDMIVVGNTRFPNGPSLFYTKDEWAAFINHAKQDKFEDSSKLASVVDPFAGAGITITGLTIEGGGWDGP